MIHHLNGTVVQKSPDAIVLSCGGVGFYVMIPSSVYALVPEVGERGIVYTYLNVKEDGFDLYGFASEQQQATFRMLIGVSGVGPKVALAILSIYGSKDVVLAIASGDHKVFTAASGVGPKLAQRIVLELKDRIGDLGSIDPASASAGAAVSGGTAAETVAALISLGFSQSEAASAVSALPAGMTVEEMIGAALRSMGSR